MKADEIDNLLHTDRDYLDMALTQCGVEDPQRPFCCINPEHDDADPSMSVYENAAGEWRAHCFGCQACYDVYDVIGIAYQLDSLPEQRRKAAEIFNLQLDSSSYRPPLAFPDMTAPDAEAQTAEILNRVNSEPQKGTGQPPGPTGIHKPAAKPAPVLDLTERVEAAHRCMRLQNLEGARRALEYYHGRGLTDEIIDRYKLGYTPHYSIMLKNYPEHNNSSFDTSFTYTLPYWDAAGKCMYFTAEINDRSLLESYKGLGKYRKIKGHPEPLFNGRYILRPPARMIWITEGIYDALSVEVCGGYAISPVGVGARRLAELLERNRPDCLFIVALDNDDTGLKKRQDFIDLLTRYGLPHLERGAPEPYKDMNEALQKAGAPALTAYIRTVETQAAPLLAEYDRQKAEDEAGDELADMTPEERAKTEEPIREAEEVQALATSAHLDAYTAALDTQEPPISTGLLQLDMALCGGLRPGLYCIGAISSLGKTALCLQIMDAIAAAGRDVLIISLEMARAELISRSISRLTFTQTRHAGGIATTDLRTAAADPGRRQVRAAALEAYRAYAGNIYILEGIGDIGTAAVRYLLERHIRVTGRRPVLLIDYLQILAPYNERATDKQNVDRNVTELKRLSRDHNIPLIGISSFNRENYLSPVNMASFKESGAVEYSSDVLIAMQYNGMDYREHEKDGDRVKRIRALIREQQQAGKDGKAQTIQIKVLKNRSGHKGEALLSYWPKYHTFEDPHYREYGHGDYEEPEAADIPAIIKPLY